MHNATTSRHIRSATELIIIVPIKNEFVPITEFVMTYATRVSAVLKALAEIRQAKVERGFGDPVGPIELLELIHRVQWTVLEPFNDVGSRSSVEVTRQLRGPQIMLTSHFDGSWEDYFHQLVDVGRPLLDLIFSHCEGFEGRSCADGYEGFADFIREHQRPCDFLYATAPEVTISDIRYYTRLPAQLASGHAAFHGGSVPSVRAEATAFVASEETHNERTRATLRAVHGLYDMGERLFCDVTGLKTRAGDVTDKRLYEDAVASVLEHEPDRKRLASVLKAAPPHERPLLGQAAQWVRDILERQQPVVLADPEPKPEELFKDVQANILSAHGRTGVGRLLLLQCTDAEGLRTVLRRAKSDITSEATTRSAAAPDTCVQLGITYYGFKLLGMPESMLERFPREFREGMEERAGVLGDVAENHPKLWRLPLRPDGLERVHLSAVHVVMTVVGVEEIVERIVAGWRHRSPAWELAHELKLDAPRATETSQPVPPKGYRAKGVNPPQRDRLPLSAFLLGYDARARNASHPLFKNGTFLAMRKMQQDHAALAAYVDQVVKEVAPESAAGRQPAELKEEVKALIIGRKSNGDMLGALQPPVGTQPNDFDFEKDPAGELCPYHSHVRRTNPRSEGTPRIVRRALPYPAEPRGLEQGESGLLFMAYCASLSQQYELVQRYVNGGNSTGILSRQNDLLCGAPLQDTGPRFISVAGRSAAQPGSRPQVIRLPERTKPFVTLRWGLYVFVPSLSALDWLAPPEAQAARASAHGAVAIDEAAAPPHELAVDEWERLLKTESANSIARGEARIKELAELPAKLRLFEWKRLLEEVPEAGSAQALHANDVAAAITELHGGVLQISGASSEAAAAGGLAVVTTEALAQQVLSKDEYFSVSEYRERLKEALDDHYLGYDTTTVDTAVTGRSYREQSSGPNYELAKLSTRAFTEARDEAKAVLSEPAELELDPDGESPDGAKRSTIAIRDLAYAVVSKLCHDWLDLPEMKPDQSSAAGVQAYSSRVLLMKSLERFLIASRYCFQAMPVPHLAEQARKNRPEILADYNAAPFKGPIATLLHAPSARQGFQAQDQQHDQRMFQRMALLGAVGFAPPAVGAIVRVVDQWIELETLWQLQKQVRDSGQQEQAVILQAVYAALAQTPAPPTLYRTATMDTKLGGVTIPKGARVIVNLSAVYTDAVKQASNADPGQPAKPPEAWFFGGVHGGAQGKKGTPHGCPAREAGALVMAGVVSALLEQKNLRRERRLVLSYDRLSDQPGDSSDSKRSTSASK